MATSTIKVTAKTPKQAAARAGTSAKTAPLSRIGRVLPWLLIVGGIIGIFASTMITVEKFTLASNPHYQPVCNLNPIISCGSVMESKQAHAFGFMNTYIGLIGFPVLVTIGMAMLSGAKFKRWYWQGMQVGLTFGILFAYWLLLESIFRIRALCPYCLSVDVALTVVFWYVSLYNVYEGNFSLPAGLRPVGQFVKRHHLDILVTWFILVILLILQHFWYYFGQHI
jgi:uncharacterized membrane protein